MAGGIFGNVFTLNASQFWRGTTNYGGTALKQSGNSGGIQVPWVTLDSANNDSTTNGIFLRYFDAPNVSSGSATRYKLGYRQTNGTSAQVVTTNRAIGSTSGTDFEAGITSITVWEIAP